jgi:endonuclease/exonuclease/phosphatase family protein
LKRVRDDVPTRARHRVVALLLCAGLSACVARPAVIEPTVALDAPVLVDEPALGDTPDPVDAPVLSTPAVIDVLTYNVAGLPHWVAKVDGRKTHPLIGPALADFDLVLLQEDFWYHHLIDAPHAWQVRPRRGELFRLGDGLARFSKHPLGAVEHVPWQTAHGWSGHYNDRLAWKGFAAGRLSIGPSEFIWVYNVHFDAGGSRGDREAREHQREQLIADILARTAPTDALIVAGDFNTGASGLSDLRECTGLEDSGVGGIDRVLFRSGRVLQLSVAADQPPSTRLDELRGLSDHGAVLVRFALEQQR